MDAFRALRPLSGYILAIALVAVFTGVVAVLRLVTDAANISMLYLLAVIASAVVGGSRSAIVASIGSFLTFNFFFVEPR